MDHPSPDRSQRMGQAAFEAVALTLLSESDVEEGTGFGTGLGTSPGLRTRAKIFAMLHCGELVVKLPAQRCAELVEAGRARPFEIAAATAASGPWPP